MDNTNILLSVIIGCTVIYILYAMKEKGCFERYSSVSNPPEYPCENCIMGVYKKFYDPISQYCHNIDSTGRTCGGQHLATQSYAETMHAETKLTCGQICK